MNRHTLTATEEIELQRQLKEISTRVAEQIAGEVVAQTYRDHPEALAKLAENESISLPIRVGIRKGIAKLKAEGTL